jgi:hypothetical protein
MSRGPERSGKKLKRAERRQRAAELVTEGHSLRTAETVLRQEGFGAGKSTLARDLRSVREALAEKTQETIAAHRAAQLEKLAMLEDFIARSDMQDRFQVEGLLGVHNAIARLLGLNAERSAVNIGIGVNASGQPAIAMEFLDAIFAEERDRTGEDDVRARFEAETQCFCANDFAWLWEQCRARRQQGTSLLLDAHAAPDHSALGAEGQPSDDRAPERGEDGSDDD